MSKRALAYDMRAIKVDGQDVEEVYEKSLEALEHARSGEGPVFLDVEVWRMHGHYIGDPQAYRSKDDIREAAEEHDPLACTRARLELSDAEASDLDAEVAQVVEDAVEFAKASSDRAPEDALRNVYA
jgi:pyruvate dehydrogenase E1 component alpha subunit